MYYMSMLLIVGIWPPQHKMIKKQKKKERKPNNSGYCMAELITRTRVIIFLPFLSQSLSLPIYWQCYMTKEMLSNSIKTIDMLFTIFLSFPFSLCLFIVVFWLVQIEVYVCFCWLTIYNLTELILILVASSICDWVCIWLRL